MSEEILQKMYDEVTNKMELAIKITEQHEMQNSQMFLNWLDTINKLSVSH